MLLRLDIAITKLNVHKLCPKFLFRVKFGQDISGKIKSAGNRASVIATNQITTHNNF